MNGVSRIDKNCARMNLVTKKNVKDPEIIYNIQKDVNFSCQKQKS